MKQRDTMASPAHLEKAAPLMYEALKAILDAEFPIRQRKLNRSDEVEWTRLRALWLARDAIEKAETGRRPVSSS